MLNSSHKAKRDLLTKMSFIRNTDGVVTSHEHYLYRGYLQIASLDMMEGQNQVLINAYVWDPTQPVATRPLAIFYKGSAYYYGWDLTKNITEIFSLSARLQIDYVYTPFGQVRENGIIPQSARRLAGRLDKSAAFAPKGRGADGAAVSQPIIQWSSEYHDAETGLVYYNYRYYNPRDGRWTRRDPVEINYYYRYCNNSSIDSFDLLGLKFCHKKVIITHFEDKIGDENNKLRKGDIAVGHYGSDQKPRANDDGVLPHGTKVKVHVYGYGSFEGKVADKGGFDKKKFNKNMQPEDWIDVWDPEKSRKSITRKGCIETEVKDGCPCPRRYSEGQCPKREDGKYYWDDGKR